MILFHLRSSVWRREVPRLVLRIAKFQSQKWLNGWKTISHFAIFFISIYYFFHFLEGYDGTHSLLFGLYSMHRLCIFGNIWYSNRANLIKVKVEKKRQASSYYFSILCKAILMLCIYLRPKLTLAEASSCISKCLERGAVNATLSN